MTQPSATDLLRPTLSSRWRDWRLFVLLLVGGAGVIVPRFFFEVRADSWPDLLWLPAVMALYLTISLVLRRRGIPTWGAWYALFVFAAVTPMANEFGRALGEVLTPAGATPMVSLMTRHFFATLLPVAGVIALHRLVGASSNRAYFRKGRVRLGLGIGLGVFVVVGSLSMASAAALVNGEFGSDQLAGLLPWLMLGVLLNGIREEVWFRGVLLHPFAESLGFRQGNILQSTLFALPHLTVEYTTATLGLMVATFAAGVIFGLLARVTGSLLSPVLVHAASDIPIWLGILADV